MSYRTRDLKALAESYEEKFDENMIDDLRNLLKEHLEDLMVDDVDSNDIFDIVESWKDSLPERGTWALDQADGFIMDKADEAYELKRDKDMGIY